MAISSITDNRPVIQPDMRMDGVILSRALEAHVTVERDTAPDGADLYYLLCDRPFSMHLKHRNPIGKSAYAPQQCNRNAAGYSASVVLYDDEYVLIQEVR